ncbi:E3 ubiquitin-protein ligase RNF14-like [Prorops nasuta]|uniref:E3 ubiquitin-protein ligase RNF14-like n=1 Tax=Prorops nasuta TaxID=863751 RepID=UPI0034CDD8BC
MDDEKQKDEIIVLESIYNKEEFSYHFHENTYQCAFKVFISVPPDYFITYKDVINSEELKKVELISHLPPLILCTSLPNDYPSVSQPDFTLCCSWLSRSPISKLCKKLDKIWEENKGEEILFLWIAFLKDETLLYLNQQKSLDISYIYTLYKVSLGKIHGEISTNILDKLSSRNKKCKIYDKRAIMDFVDGRDPIQLIKNHNEEMNQVEFDKNFYTCKICFTEKVGERCTKFMPCSHVFCKECMTNYLEVRIKDGAVININCPEEKCLSEASHSQIKNLLSPELFARYDSILLNATLNTMTDILYCPRKNCQYPVSQEPNEDMASCPACQFTFCIYCKMVYHGIETCKVNSVEKQQLIKDYQSASKERREELEQRYGKKRMQMLVENSMTESWMNENSNKCPRCNAAIEKIDGCNKMVCIICNTYFCWICRQRLSRSKPYSHFNDPSSSCFNMLYHRLIADEEEEDADDENFAELNYGIDNVADVAYYRFQHVRNLLMLYEDIM